MSKVKYTIIDKSEDVVGFLVINEPAPSFQHMAAAGSALDSPYIGRSIFWLAILGGTTIAFVGVAGLPGWVGAGAGFVAATGLTGVVAWRSDSSPADEPESSGVIKVEHYDQRGRLRGFDDIDSESGITDDILRTVAGRMVANDFRWSKGATTAGRGGISGPMHDRVKEEFLRLGYLQPLPNGANGYKLTLKGRGVLRSVKSPTPYFGPLPGASRRDGGN